MPVDAFLATQLGNRLLAAKILQHEADLLGRKFQSRRPSSAEKTVRETLRDEQVTEASRHLDFDAAFWGWVA